MFKPEYIVIHHTLVSRDDNPKQFEAVKKYHIGKGWGDIGYHFLIEPDGTIMKGRSEITEGAHCREQMMNLKSFGVCLSGNFDVEIPTKKQMQALKDVVRYLRVKYDIHYDKIKYHRDYAPKSCPGKLFTDDMKQVFMALKEIKRDANGGYYFIKRNDNGKQKIDFSKPDQAVALLLTAITREFGIDTISEKDLESYQDKKYVL